MRFQPLPNAAEIMDANAVFTPTGEPRLELLRGRPQTYMGVDLGQAHDHAAIVMIQRLELRLPDVNPASRQRDVATLIAARYAERIPLGLSYPTIARYVADLAVQPAVAENNGKIVVDATGLGAPVVDLLREIPAIRPRVIPVVITSGEFPTEANGRHYVPKRDLIDGVRIAFEGRRITIAKNIDGLANLTEELENMRHGRKSRKQDDLVLALSLAWWKAARDAGRLS